MSRRCKLEGAFDLGTKPARHQQRAYQNVRKVRRNRENIFEASRRDQVRTSRAFQNDFQWPAGSILDSLCRLSGLLDQNPKNGFRLVTSSLFGTQPSEIRPNIHPHALSKQITRSCRFLRWLWRGTSWPRGIPDVPGPPPWLPRNARDAPRSVVPRLHLAGTIEVQSQSCRLRGSKAILLK